ncbi:rCG30331, partial [Rattus norvegicus]
ESVPFQWSELTRGPSFIWHATHQKSLSQKQFSSSTPGVSLSSSWLGSSWCKTSRVRSRALRVGAGGTRPRNLRAARAGRGGGLWRGRGA